MYRTYYPVLGHFLRNEQVFSKNAQRTSIRRIPRKRLFFLQLFFGIRLKLLLLKMNITFTL